MGIVSQRRDSSESHLAMSEQSSSRPGPAVLSKASGLISRVKDSVTGSSDSVSDSGDSVSDAPQDDGDTSKLGAPAISEVGATGKAGKKGGGFFEAIKDPFEDPFPDNIGGIGKLFQMERPCGEACTLEKPSANSDEATFDERESGTSIQTSNRSAGSLFGNVSHSVLHRSLGGLSDDTSRSGPQAPRSLKDIDSMERGSSGSVVRKEPSN
jgi:hypothetical protein